MSEQYPKLILPRRYISWSQLDCWVKNKPRYVREYFEDGSKLKTRYLDFGSKFSKMVEELCEIMERMPDRLTAVQLLAKDYPMDENMMSVLLELDIEGISEYQVGNSGRDGDPCPVVKVRGEVPILCYFDKYVPRTGGIQEYKTGLVPWTQAKVIKHDQLLMYGVGLKWAGKPLPPYADLHHIETMEIQEDGQDFWRDGAKIILATGKIKTFHREFDEREFLRMEDLIVRVAWEISDAYQDYLSEL